MSTPLRSLIDVLNARLGQAGLTTPIAYPNNVFTPQKGVSYLQVELAGRGRTPLGFGADSVQQWSGIYQISVYVGRDTGTREQDEIAQKVLNAFPRGLNLPTPNGGANVIVEYSTAASPEVFGDWSNLPIAIHWFATDP